MGGKGDDRRLSPCPGAARQGEAGPARPGLPICSSRALQPHGTEVWSTEEEDYRLGRPPQRRVPREDLKKAQNLDRLQTREAWAGGQGDTAQLPEAPEHRQ